MSPKIDGNDLETRDFDMFQCTKKDQRRNGPPKEGSITHSSANTSVLDSTAPILRGFTLIDIYRQQGSLPSKERNALNQTPTPDQK